MYERFYQLTTNPFRLEPDPNFCFSHSGYKRAREYLEYALAQGEGFVMVTGRPGTGKTLLLETFLKELGTGNVVARRIAVSNYTGIELLRAVAYAYDIDAAELDKSTLRHRIHRYFIKQQQTGRRVLLIIDEAQALQHSALEELRILTDLQAQSRIMLQIFLVGQESLQDLMHSSDMEQFQQRVIANYQLAPLNLQDTRSYIEHRLLQAGWEGDPQLSGDAVLGIYQLSHGVPRHINKICNRLLLLGFGKASHAFEKHDVQEISAEMHDERLTPMETDQATLHDADNVENIPEIHNGLISIDDLAISADKLDAPAASAVSRQATALSDPYIDVHQYDPVDWSVPYDSGEKPGSESVSKLYINRLRHRKTLVAATAVVIVTVISVAMLSPVLDETGSKSSLSQLGHAIRENQGAAMPGEATAMPAVTSEIRRSGNPKETRQLENGLQVVVARMPEGAEDLDKYGPPSAGNLERDSVAKQQVVVAGMLPVVPDSESVEPGHAEIIEQLLYKGQQSLDDFRLLTPEGDNAYDYYRAVLKLDPANSDAIKGIQKIVDRYITLSRKAADKNEYARARRYITRGLSIQPSNSELLALQTSIDKAIQGPSDDAGALAQDEGVSLETESPGEPPIQDALIQGIRNFFEKRKAEARSGVVHTPAGWDE